MKNLKDPAFLLSAANSIAIIGGGLWLYKLNAETVAEIQKLKLAVETFLKQQANSMGNEFKAIKSSMNDFDNRIKEIDQEFTEKVDQIEYLIDCVNSLQEQTNTKENPITLPRPPRRKSRRGHGSRSSHRGKLRGRDGSDEEDSKGRDDRQDRQDRQDRKNRKSRKTRSRKSQSKRHRHDSESDSSSSSDSSESESSSSSDSGEDELDEAAVQAEIKKNRQRQNKHRSR